MEHGTSDQISNKKWNKHGTDKKLSLEFLYESFDFRSAKCWNKRGTWLFQKVEQKNRQKFSREDGMKKDIFDLNKIDYTDSEALADLQQERAIKWLKCFFKAKRGDVEAIEAIRKHEAEDEEIRGRAAEKGNYWM